MNKITAFGLFIQQCLLYPLTSPFLPAEVDVKKNVTYANGELIGRYEAGPVLPQWQPEPYLIMTWLSATIYAEFLEENGVTVSAEPQYYWQLPTINQLTIACTNMIDVGWVGGPTDFIMDAFYWTDVEWDPGRYIDVRFSYDYVVITSDYGSYEFNVRCVHVD